MNFDLWKKKYWNSNQRKECERTYIQGLHEAKHNFLILLKRTIFYDFFQDEGRKNLT